MVQKEKFRDQVFSLLPQLQVLDGIDKEGREVLEESSEEEFEDDGSGESGEDEEEGFDAVDEEGEGEDEDKGLKQFLTAGKRPAAPHAAEEEEEVGEEGDDSEGDDEGKGL